MRICTTITESTKEMPTPIQCHSSVVDQYCQSDLIFKPLPDLKVGGCDY